MSRKDGFPGTEAGHPYPTGYVISWFHSRDEADAAVSELRGAGFEKIEVLTGDEAIDLSRNIAENLGPIEGLLRKIPSQEEQLETKFLSAAKAGSTVLAVYAPTRDLTTVADEILVRCGAHARHKFGKLAMEELT